MKVKITDKEKVLELLKESEGKATDRKIGSYENLQAIIKKAENWLMDIAQTKTPRALAGTRANWTAYESHKDEEKPFGTYVRWYWGADGVARVVGIGRQDVKTANHFYNFEPSQKYLDKAFKS